MIQNYLKIAFRALKNQWRYSLINIMGIAIGMTCCMFILFYVHDEKSYDQFHKDAGRIYRVARVEINTEGQREPKARTVRAIAFTLRQDLAEVEDATTIFHCRPMSMSYDGQPFFETRVFEADSDVFNVFTFTFVKGTAKDALNASQSIVITESTARKYFGTADPIGKMIRSEDMDYYVTAVLKDVPPNSHFHFDLLIPLRTVEIEHNTEWLGSQNYFTYVKLKKMTLPSAFEAKLAAMARKYNPISRDTYFIQPLTGIHLNSNLRGELEPNGDAGTLRVVMIIAFFVIITASVNYINLATARATRRAKEVGIRKTSGALRNALVVQFLTESVVTAMMAFVVAIVLMMLLVHPFNNLAGKHLDLFHRDFWSIWLLFACFAAIIGLLAGLYPALLLSSFSPVKVLKGGSVRIAGSAGWLRRILVGFQFTVSIGLIIATIAIVRQMKYISKKDPGFDKEQVIVISHADRLQHREVLEQRIEQLSGVAYVGASTTTLGKANWTSNIRTNHSQTDRLIDFCQIDYEYLDALGIPLLKGRTFSREFPADTINTIILNETAVKELNLNDPVGHQLIWNEGGPDTVLYASVVGVVRDFHYNSFHEPIRPFAFLIRNNFFVQQDFTSNLFVRTVGGHTRETIGQIEKLWKELVPQKPFDYVFMDDSFRELHAAEERFEILFSCLTTLAIFIACLGLFALVAFVTEQKTKEIGIRKVLGASFLSILAIINKDFIKLVLVSLTIASPIALYFINQWLNGFAYHADVTWWVFVMAGVVTLIIVFAATGYQSIKASLANPVHSLKTE